MSVFGSCHDLFAALLHSVEFFVQLQAFSIKMFPSDTTEVAELIVTFSGFFKFPE